MPLSYFDKDKNLGGKAAVNITITGVGGETTIIGSGDSEGLDDDIIDVEDVMEISEHDGN